MKTTTNKPETDLPKPDPRLISYVEKGVFPIWIIIPIIMFLIFVAFIMITK